MFFKEKVPDYYPELSDEELNFFLSDEEFYRIKKFPTVILFPPISGNDLETDCFAVSLGRLLIRNLMLVQNISVHGPEDTPVVPYKFLLEETSLIERDTYSISGELSLENGFSGHFYILTKGETKELKVAEQHYKDFILKCSEKIAEAVGGEVNEDVRHHWQFGLPEKFDSLLKYGHIILLTKAEKMDAKENDARLIEILQEDQSFVLPALEFSDNFKDAKNQMIKAIQKDPYDAQMHWCIFLKIWDSSGYQRDAMQMIRKAIELSPGHGKAHMCAPHASLDSTKMLKHSELGYLLLPGNSYAISNYNLYLTESKKWDEPLLESLVLEALKEAPGNPLNLENAVELYVNKRKYQEALDYALKLKDLIGPPMTDKVLQCYLQSKKNQLDHEAGTFNPCKYNSEIIEWLKNKLLSGGEELARIKKEAVAQLKRSKLYVNRDSLIYDEDDSLPIRLNEIDKFKYSRQIDLQALGLMGIGALLAIGGYFCPITIIKWLLYILSLPVVLFAYQVLIYPILKIKSNGETYSYYLRETKKEKIDTFLAELKKLRDTARS